MHSRPVLGASLLAVLLLLGSACAPPSEEASGEAEAVAPEPTAVRVAQFNIRELSLEKIESDDPEAVAQLEAATAILQRIRPDVLVLNEIDAHEHQPGGLEGPTRAFLERWLAAGDDPLDFPYLFVAPSNTGRLSGLDLDDRDGIATAADVGTRKHGNDSWGYGEYPGQYSMALLSRFPIDAEAARTFQTFRWIDLPDAHLPEGWYSEEELEVVRLSSKSHWDVPVEIGEKTLHLWISHPTPQGFDGEENRNGRRNFDEIGFWRHYLDGSEAIHDDDGERGGYDSDAPFVIAGDLNASPVDEPLFPDLPESRNAIAQLLEHPRIADSGAFMTSTGALAGREPGAPMHWERSTTAFREGRRIDYLLPSTGLEVVGGGVFWPSVEDDPEGAAWAEAASDHRAIWLDLEL